MQPSPSVSRAGGETGGLTGGETGGLTGGETGGLTGGLTGGETGGLSGGETGGLTGGLTGGETGGLSGGLSGSAGSFGDESCPPTLGTAAAFRWSMGGSIGRESRFPPAGPKASALMSPISTAPITSNAPTTIHSFFIFPSFRRRNYGAKNTTRPRVYPYSSRPCFSGERTRTLPFRHSNTGR